ncbi:MAG: ATP-binding protein [Elusimicrobiota bacterium]|jgi:PAS domain S-box-containing protein
MKISTKFLAGLFPLTVITSQVALAYTGHSVHAALTSERVRTALLQAESMRRRGISDIRAGRESLLLPYLLEVQRGTAASDVFIQDNEGRVLAHTNVAETGRRLLDDWTRKAIASEQPSTRERSLSGQETALDIAVPLMEAPPKDSAEEFMLMDSGSAGRRIATLRLIMPLGQTLKTQAEILGRVRQAVLFSSAGLSVLTLFLLARVLSPLRLMTAATEKISRGEYDARVPLRSKDEVGELAQRFNRMSDALATTTVSKDFLNGILESIQDFLIVTDAEGRVKMANRAVFENLGYGREEIIGKDVGVLFGEGMPASWQDRQESLMNAEVQIRAKDGRMAPVLLSLAVLKDAGGRPAGFVAAAKDISERKALEGQMRQSEKLSAVGRLAAGVAHEINNPLGVILGFAQSAARRVSAEDPLSLPLSSIEREALRCKNLVQGLLTFSRQSKPLLEPVALNSMAFMTLSMIEALTRVRSVTLVREFGPEIKVQGDSNQLQQIVINLCSNAVDAMSPGGILTVRTRAHDDGKSAVLEVQDTGTGIPQDIRDKIFEPFFTTKKAGQGTGLGLALVHEIVLKHQGSISLKSEIGKGTIFTVLLPLAASETAA